MSTDAMTSNFVVGIDLGTTNSALAHIDVARPGRLVSDGIVQLIGPGEVLPRPTLPSFLYLAGEHELPPGALRLPWTALDVPEPRLIVGELARAQGTQVPGR